MKFTLLVCYYFMVLLELYSLQYIWIYFYRYLMLGIYLYIAMFWFNIFFVPVERILVLAWYELYLIVTIFFLFCLQFIFLSYILRYVNYYLFESSTPLHPIPLTLHSFSGKWRILPLLVLIFMKMRE